MSIIKTYRMNILGCGGSIGVPSIEKGWDLCDWKENKNYRLRTSALLEIFFDNGKSYNILFDTGPDFRQQALNSNIKKVDTILYSHYHADHIYGLDEIRSINRLMQKSINAYAEETTIANIKKAFSYVISNPTKLSSDIFYRPVIEFFPIKYYQDLELDYGIKVLPTKQIHGRIDSTGFVIDGKIGYATDFVSFPEETISAYKNLDLIILSCFTRNSHDSHMKLSDVLNLIEVINPKKVILTHMGGTMDYQTLCKELPQGIYPAYDGMIIETE